MYEGSNPIAIQSREWLVEALFALMRENSYSRITVRDICGKADLSRQTFYNFFTEKNDIIRYCIRSRLDPFVQLQLNKRALAISDIVRSFEGFQRQNASLLQLIFDGEPESILTQEISEILDCLLPRAYRQRKAFRNDYGYAFLNGALTHVIVCWFKDHERISVDELSEQLTNIISGKSFASV